MESVAGMEHGTQARVPLHGIRAYGMSAAEEEAERKADVSWSHHATRGCIVQTLAQTLAQAPASVSIGAVGVGMALRRPGRA